ncbi:MAG TPA: Clp protease N-terminal domain-containing protein [Friedmanniella sp.]
MFERFTQAARTAVVGAQQEAREQSSPAIGSEHLLFGVLTDVEGAPAVVLRRWGVDAAKVASVIDGTTALDDEALSALGVDLGEVRRRAEDEFGPGALDPRARASRRGTTLSKGHIPFTTEVKGALAQAVRAAVFSGHSEIGSAQLFLGLLADDGTTRRVLHRLGVTASAEELVRLVQAELDQAG